MIHGAIINDGDTLQTRQRQNKRKQFTIVPVAGDGGMGEEEVVEVGVLLD